MLPLDPRFRKMVHKYIPQLNPHDLNRYECLLAYYWQLAQERDIIQNNVPDDRNPPVSYTHLTLPTMCVV